MITWQILSAQLLFLESENPDKDIFLYINSPGGSVTAGMSIYDTMQFIKPNVGTPVCWTSLLYGRFLLRQVVFWQTLRSMPNSRVMIHQPLGGFYGQASDIQIHAQEILSIKNKLNTLLCRAYRTATRCH
ncbi:ATP-dependent Clp protease proteolytic subunit [Vibrio metschnikovii]